MTIRTAFDDAYDAFRALDGRLYRVKKDSSLSRDIEAGNAVILISFDNRGFFQAINLTSGYDRERVYFSIGLVDFVSINPRDLTPDEAQNLANYELRQNPSQLETEASAQSSPSCTPQIPTTRKEYPEDYYG